MRVQISGHSSVQSSFIFKSRMVDSPIYLFRFKKIKQGKLLYPKIFPLFSQYISQRISNAQGFSRNWSNKLTIETLRPQIRVCTKNDWSRNFDLYNLLVWNMVSRIQLHHFDLISYINSFLKINWLIAEIQSTDEKSIDTPKVKLWLFGQH